jgi:integrase
MCVRLHLAPFFGDTPIRRISTKQIEALIVELQRKGLRPKSVRNYVGTLSALLNFAVRKKWIAATPMTAVDLPALTSGDEIEDPLRFLLSGRGPRARRRRAARALPRPRPRLREHRPLDAHEPQESPRPQRPDGTNRRPRAARVRADSNWIRQHDPVFADPVTGRPVARTPMMRRYPAALTAAGLDPAFRFHDLRHTFGTSMARAGEPVTTIQARLGHNDLKTTQRYMHHAPAADEAERVERAFAIAPDDSRAASSGAA